MIYGVGTDVVEIGRIEKALDALRRALRASASCARRSCKRFERTPQPAAYLAKRFAAKEAFTKALGTGIQAPANWHGVWVTNLPSGKPVLEFSAAAADAPGEARRLARPSLPRRRARRRRRHGDPRMRKVRLPLGPAVIDVVATWP